MSKPSAPLLVGIAIVAILGGVMSAQFMRARHTNSDLDDIHLESGTVLPDLRALPPFQLMDGNAQPFSLAQLQGHWNLLFFGYTSCPDVCPTTLTTLAQVHQQLADLPDAQRLQMVFVSVDSKRDTPAQVGQYVKFFSKDFIGLTGASNDIAQLTRAMGVPYAIHDDGNGAYTVDHAATLFLIDPQARMTAVFSPPHKVSNLANDLRAVITHLSANLSR